MMGKIKFSKQRFAYILTIIFAAAVVLHTGCNKDDDATCSDGIKNQDETGTDCGGPCAACPSCSDGIQNQNETSVDCGGPCPSCVASLTATIDGVPFTATSLQVVAVVGTLVIQATNGTQSLNLIHIGAFAPGTYSMQVAVTTYTSPTITCQCTTSSITFSSFNTAAHRASGSFSFVCVDATSGTHNITSGVFVNLSY